MNLSAIFIKAHQIARKCAAKFGAYRAAFRWALKTVWSDEKFVSTWGGIRTLKETEKAFKIAVIGADRDNIIWVPKSLCQFDPAADERIKVYAIKGWFWKKNQVVDKYDLY